MSDSERVYLIEAYAAPDGGGSVSPEALRAEVESEAGVRVIGLLGVPIDGALLCLVAADSAAGVEAVHRLAQRYGPAARLLPVSWAPADADPIAFDAPAP